jgi:Tfp pilus assembly protein PilF
VQSYNQGVQLMHGKKFAEAQIKFEQALSQNPNFAEAHNNLGYFRPVTRKTSSSRRRLHSGGAGV